jgi:hypothetical protein
MGMNFKFNDWQSEKGGQGQRVRTMQSSGIWRRVDLVWSDVSEEHIDCIQSAATWSPWFLARGLFYPEHGGNMFLRNVSSRKIYVNTSQRCCCFLYYTTGSSSSLCYGQINKGMNTVSMERLGICWEIRANSGLWIEYFSNFWRIDRFFYITETKTKLRSFSSQANYTDRATAACRRSQCQLLRIKGVAWSTQRIPMVVNIDFVDPEPVLFHSSSSSVDLTRLSGPCSRPTPLFLYWLILK